MKATITAISAILMIGTIAPFATADGIPDWVKNNAGWWASGDISESDFISGIQFLIEDGIITVPPTSVSSSETPNGIPDWVKNNAGWWASGDISESDFISGIQFLVGSGLISIPTSAETEDMKSEEPENMDSELKVLQAELDKCVEITKAYDRLNCEKDAKHQINIQNYKNTSQTFAVGPITFYWPGLGTEGNSFEITSSGQALLNLRMLVENTGSTQTESLFCTGPAVCNYDVSNGDKEFKYSGMDFTNGQVVMKPGESKEFNMFFGPNIGGGGTTFEYDSGKDYYFRINEPYGSNSIPLNLG